MHHSLIFFRRSRLKPADGLGATCNSLRTASLQVTYTQSSTTATSEFIKNAFIFSGAGGVYVTGSRKRDPTGTLPVSSNFNFSIDASVQGTFSYSYGDSTYNEEGATQTFTLQQTVLVNVLNITPGHITEVTIMNFLPSNVPQFQVSGDATLSWVDYNGGSVFFTVLDSGVTFATLQTALGFYVTQTVIV